MVKRIVKTVNTTNSEETDLYLRKLWSEFRSEFDNYAWNYWGYRHGNTYLLGYLSLGLKENIEISYSYKTRGTIKNIIITRIEDLSSNDISRINKVLELAIDFKKKLLNKWMSVNIKSLDNLDNYNGHSFKIIPGKKNCSQLHLNIQGFDKKDFGQETLIRATDLIIFISICFRTNCWLSQDKFHPRKKTVITDNNFIKDIDQLIKYRKELGFVYDKILESAKLIKDGIVINYTSKKILYPKALKKSRFIFPSKKKRKDNAEYISFRYTNPSKKKVTDSAKFKVGTEIAIISFISSIEILSTINNNETKVCKKCHQKLYSISKKVRDLCCALLGDHTAKYMEMVS